MHRLRFILKQTIDTFPLDFFPSGKQAYECKITKAFDTILSMNRSVKRPYAN